jgi:hypothetical protein
VIRWLQRAIIVLLLLSCGSAVVGDDLSSVRREDALKAAYLFNFTKFVEWPGADDGSALTLCFVGGAGVQQALAGNIADRRIGSHRVIVRALTPQSEVVGCSVLYVQSSLEMSARPSTVIGAPVLTVSDASGFAHQGGIIELFTEGNRLRFIVNMANARRAGIRISSSLLQLASVVEKDGDP